MVAYKDSKAYIKKLDEIYLNESVTSTLKQTFSNALDEDSYRFIMAIVDNPKELIPIPRNAIQKCLRGLSAEDRQFLIDSEIITRDDYYTVGKCYCYGVGPILDEVITSAIPESILEGGIVNTATLKRVKPIESKFSRDDSTLVRRAISMIVNKINVTKLNEVRYVDLQEAKKDKAARFRFFGNDRCFDAVRRQELTVNSKGVGQYVPAYKFSRTGRMFEVGGGMQGVSSRWKKAAYDLPNVRNYDLKSSQIVALLELGRNYLPPESIDTLEAYIDSNKQVYADTAGIPTELWKAGLMALFFGSNLAPNLKCEVYKNFFNYYGHDKAIANMHFQNFRTVACPFVQVKNEWFKALKIIVEEFSYRSDRSYCIKNAMSKIFKLDKGYSMGELSAHMLQGLEGAYIFALINDSWKYSYEVLSNEHDGIVVEGEIPLDAKLTARVKSKFNTAVLVEKAWD